MENEGTPTSCEGDKAVLEDEAAGGILLPLNDIAPLQTTANGVAIIGSASSPIQLPSPVPLEDIGYLNIHANQDPASGIACANVRINPGGFVRAEQAESPSGGEAAAPATEAPASSGAQPGLAPMLHQQRELERSPHLLSLLLLNPCPWSHPPLTLSSSRLLFLSRLH